ncbi:MAG: peptide deformylase [Culturomica sp.]|jgi:peptide deformylase|nr:peptide deformylase [Culturomica sp.]
MLLPIYVYGHPILRKKSEDIPEDYPNLDEFLKNLWHTMEVADGVGLAAPQVGRNIRIFVVDGTGFSDQHPEVADFRKVFINAHIVERSDELVNRSEGCLSVPGIHEYVKRPDKIRIIYEDENRIKHDKEFDGIKAWIIQHEYDHLEGIVFTDHLSPLRKRLLQSKLNAISRGKFKSEYKVVLPK